MTYRSTKTWGHDLGLSAVFRQPSAQSHCNKLHGYALAFCVQFEAAELDERGWVIDFGGLKGIKEWLQDQFDHKLLVAKSDPCLPDLWKLDAYGLADVKVVPAVGCEAFAKLVFDKVSQWLVDTNQAPRVHVVSVECREHGANSALYISPA